MVAYCSCDLRPSQRRYCTTKREMLAAVAMCVQFRLYLRGAKFTLRTDHRSLVWLHRFKDTEGMMTRWLHALQQFQFSIVHRPGRDHGNADGLSRVPLFPCRQCTRPGCPPLAEMAESVSISLSTLSLPVVPRMLILCLYIREKTGLHCWMMICLNRRLSRVIHFVYPLYRRRIRFVSHSHHGFHRELSSMDRSQMFLSGPSVVVAPS